MHIHVTTLDGERHFDTVTDFSEWLASQAAYWRWTASDKIPLAAEHCVRRYRALQTLIARGEQPDESALSPQSMQAVADRLSEQPILEARQPRAKYVAGVASQNIVEAAYALGYFAGADLPLSDPAALEALIGAALFRHGVRKNVESERAALKQLRDEYHGLIRHDRSAYEAASEQVRYLASEAAERSKRWEDRDAQLHAMMLAEFAENDRVRQYFNKAIEARIANHDKQLEKQHEKHEGQLAEAKRQLEEELKNAMERAQQAVDAITEHMKLKAPVEYWQEHQKSHQGAARNVAYAILITAPISLAMVFAVGWRLIGADQPQPAWGHVILFSVLVGVVIWTLKTLVRLYLSRTHLSVDSGERVVMAKTYLALITGGAAQNEREKQIVLESLFRPTSTGILGDEAVSTSALEVVAKLLRDR